MQYLLILLLFSFQAFAFPPSFIEKADNVPNICQSCYPEIIRWGGKPHCAPAAVSNSFVWLSKNGFPSLQPFQGANQNINHARLVNLLGSIMGTSDVNGTSSYQVLSGLKKYLDKKNVRYKRIAATGWRSVPNFVVVDNLSTSLDWIKEGTFGKNSVWILIGWCKLDSTTDNCEIFDGHWMTVVGYGKNREGHDDPNILVIHDPAERADRKNYYVDIVVLEHGVVDNSRKAKGILSLTGDILLKPGADRGVIQGAYRLEF